MAPGVSARAHPARRGQDRGSNWENVGSFPYHPFTTLFPSFRDACRCVRTIKKRTSFLTAFVSDSILTGFDVDGRPIIYMRPGRENTETSPRQLRHLVYILYV